MLATRLIPCLLMSKGALIKTVRFKNRAYIGDPINAVRIFNQKEVDELILLDIDVTKNREEIDFETIEKLVGECFMPICYGGGVQTLEQMRRLYGLGIEKISLGATAFSNPNLIAQAATEFGSQAVVVTLDVKKGFFGGYSVHTNQGSKDAKISPLDAAKTMERLGAGEILLYSIDRDGTWDGFDLQLVSSVAKNIGVPVIACGGAGSLEDVKAAVNVAGASAVAIGSMAVFQGKDLGVLIKFPARKDQEAAFANKGSYD